MNSPSSHSTSIDSTSPEPLIDIGANLTHECFIRDIPAVISRAKAAGLVQIMVTGASLQGSQQAAQLAQQHPGYLWASAGIHPHHADEADAAAMLMIKQLLSQPEVKAVGETGLDFFRDLCPRAQQIKAFEAHIELAIELQKPMFLHERDASKAFIEVLSPYRDQLPKVVVHCFTGEATALHSYIDMDCHIGITGWLCDERRGTHLIPLIADIPDNRLMIETDAPYLMPRNIRPKPNNRHNQPHFLSYVCQAVADARSVDYATVAAMTTANAVEFYHL
jgi:TatD DNase family protein